MDPDPGHGRAPGDRDRREDRAARTATTAAPHLVSAYDHASGTVLGQLATAAKSNEIPAVRTLLAGFDLTDVVVTVDAMHTQTDTAAAAARRRRGLRIHRQGEPADPVRGVQAPALARRGPSHHRQYRPRPPGPVHHQGRRRPGLDHLRRRRPGRSDPPDHHPGRGARPSRSST
jgi:Transposase DDE domain